MPDDDLHKYAAKTNRNLIIGAFVLLFVVGLGLIAFFYGWNAALLGGLCILGGMIPVGLVAILMFGLDRVVKGIKKE